MAAMPGTLHESTPAQPFSRREGTYAFMAALFVVALVLTNVIGTKLFVVDLDLPTTGILGWICAPLNFFEGETLTSGILTYPLTFLLTDLVSEIWGKRRASIMVIFGFVMSLMMLGILQMAVRLSPSPYWTQSGFGLDDAAQMQNAFAAVFANPGVLLGASMCAYLVAQLFDVRLYHFWWRVTKGSHMWIRNNGSTGVSQLLDTIIVNGIFLHFGTGFGPENGWDFERIAHVIWVVYLFKIMLALIDTPLIYGGKYLLERFLGIAHEPGRVSAPLG